MNDKLIKQMADLIRDFVPIEYATKTCGIDIKSHYNYINNAKRIVKDIADGHDITLSEYDNLCVQYLQAITEADGECFSQGVRQIKAHGEKDWKATARLLEARYPKLFGRSVNLNVQRMAEKLAEELDLDSDGIAPPNTEDDA